MLQQIRRLIITLVAVGVGLVTLAYSFATQSSTPLLGSPVLEQNLNQMGAFLIAVTTIVVTFALFLGFINVISVHLGRVRTKASGSVYSLVLLSSLIITLLLGVGGPNTNSIRFIFEFILQPFEATFFALLALFIATAALRAFKIDNPETLIFVLFALIVLLGQVPISIYLWGELPIIKDWILNVPTLAGVRGILLGVALGTIATGLRILLGADRPYVE
jgi:hypothetical protein